MTEFVLAGMVGLVLALVIGWALWARPLVAMRRERDLLCAEIGGLRDAEVLARLKATEIDCELRAARAAVAALSGRVDVLAPKAEALIALTSAQAERDAAHLRQLAETRGAFEALATKVLQGAQVRLAESADALMTRQRDAAGAGLEANRNALAELIDPVKTTLAKYETRLGEVEAARTEAYGGLKEQLAAVAVGQRQVSEEAAKLVSALRSSSKTSGSWGEQQLLNTLEMAGLRAGIDFTLQTHVAGDAGGKRPDAIINLPGERQLIIDSKCSLKDYLDAGEATSEAERLTAFKRHAASVRQHARGLSDKAYWTEFGAAADFVVMFIPGENFLSAAMEHDLPLLGWAFEQRILLAGPINLLAIAKTVALVWRQEKLADEAREIGKLGAEMYAAIATMAEHVSGVGRNLSHAVSSYNAFVGSLEGNVLPKARRFTEMGVEKGKKPVAAVGVVDAAVRAVAARELLLPPEPARLAVRANNPAA